MNTIFSLDAATAWHMTAFAIDLVIKATLALLAAVAVTWIARRRSAALRHRVWFLTYCGLLLLPVLPLVLPKWQIPLPWAFERISAAVSQTEPKVPLDSNSADSPRQEASGSQRTPDPFVSSSQDDRPWSANAGEIRETVQRRALETPIAPSPPVTTPALAVASTQAVRPADRSVWIYVAGLIAVVWAAGAAVFLFGILAARVRGRQLLRSAAPVLDPRWVEPFERLRESLRVTSRVRLLESSEAVVPMATGIVRHAVLLPCDTEEWPTALCRHVLIHELAHVKRRDVLQHLISRVATSLYWFHPLAWYGMRRMRLEREIACDDCVLMAGEHPCDYAAELVGIARRIKGIATPWAVCMASGSTLEERVRSMLDRARSHGPMSARAARSLLIVALAAIAMLAVVEPGTSSVRSPERPSSGLVVDRPGEGPSPAKDIAPIVNSTGADTIQGQVHEKQRAAHASTGPLVTVANASQPAPRDPKHVEPASDNEPLRLAARVFDPDGKPVAGANVAIHSIVGRNLSGPGFDSMRLGSVTTDALGRFEYSADRRSLPVFKGTGSKSPAIRYIASKPGFGLAVGTYSEWIKKPAADLKLVPDETVRGRVVNLEGRPVAGARIDVRQLLMDTEYLKQLQQMEAKGISEPFGIRGSASAVTSPAMFPTATTDAEGRFEIRGLGRDRIANLRIVGPQISVAVVQVVTRPMQTVRVRLRNRGGGPAGKLPRVFYGSQFEFVAEPGVPVEGRVTDEETGVPIAGVIVASDRLLVPTSLWSDGLLSAVSDAKGRFKLEGLPLNDENTLRVFPLDLPYLSAGDLSLPRGKPPASISRDIKLRRGVWAVGHVLDAKTGKPVRGNVFYTPFHSNAFAKNYSRYQSRIRIPLGREPAGITDDEGRFRSLVIPGRGVVCFRSPQRHYIGGLGATSIPEFAKDKSSRQGAEPTFEHFVPDMFQAVHEISPAADAKTVELNLAVEPGQNVELRFVDRSGKPLSGPVQSSGMDANSPARAISSDTSTVWALSPEETRTIWIKHQATGLTKFMHFTAKAEETKRTVTLERPAVLTGRFVSAEGKPYADWAVNCQYPLGSNERGNFPPVRTDSDGRFRYEIPGGGPFDVVSRSGPFVALARGLAVQPGEQIDFGEIVVNDREEVIEIKKSPKRTISTAANLDQKEKPKAVKPSKESASAAGEQKPLSPHVSADTHPATENAPLRLAGTVLQPNGEPAAGATVLLEGFLSQFKGGANKWMLVAEFSADGRGAFDREFDGRWRPGDAADIRLTALMPGYGRSPTVDVRPKNMLSVVLRLADEEPIRAHILNLEGRPISGVRVEAVEVYPSKKEWIDRWLAAIPPNAEISGIGRGSDEKAAEMKGARRTALHFPAASLEMEPLAKLPSGVTDSEGKVELRGLGREGLVLLKIVGPGIAAAKFYALTRPTKTLELNQAPQSIRHVLHVYGSQFDYIAGPATVITGIVRDEETKKPVAGAIVASDALDGVRTDSGGNLSAITDAEGRYRLDGLSRNRRITVTAARPNSEYMPTDIEVGQPRVLEPVHLDITLERGVWAVGRVFNIKTGQPVPATLFYTPFRSNKFAQEVRRSRTVNFLDYSPAGDSDDQGRFRISILPGRGVIAVRTRDNYVPAFGASKSKELSNRKTEMATFDTLIPTWFDAVADVDLQQKAAELHIDVPVDPGQDVVFKFVDRAGHRLSGARVYGMMPRHDGFTKTDAITIPATSPDQTRIMWIAQQQIDSTELKSGELRKFLHFKPIPGERERTITLDPPAVLTGRLVSPTGEPLPNVLIGGTYETDYNSLAQLSETRTDAQGRFRYEIPGGGPFRVGSQSIGLLPFARDLMVQAGEQIDFGELVVSTKGFSGAVTAKSPPKRTPPSAADAKHKE
jgi:beta-lactamase regulating signal transducer with metallopeptidase domain/protocatechuate 3,4-dioxygenase beta subunit